MTWETVRLILSCAVWLRSIQILAFMPRGIFSFEFEDEPA